MRVIVIGAGIGGLTTAIALGKVGIDAEIYEQAPELREAGAGIALMANALNALDVLGLGEEIRRKSVSDMPGALRNMRGGVLVQVAEEDLARNFAAVILHRAELQTLLAERAGRQRIHLGSACIRISEEAGEITAHFQNGESARGDALVAADGLRSLVRTQLFGPKPIRYAGYTAWRAVVSARDVPNPVMGETWGPGRRFGIVPMSGNRVYWFAANNAPEGERHPQGQAQATLLRLFKGWHQPIEALIAGTGESSILRNDLYDMDPLPRIVRGRAALLGDAAHPMTPNLGQGACQAIEDAVVLSACLKKHAQVEAAFQEYERRRRPRTSQIALRSRRFGVIGQLENPLLCGLRDFAMRMTPQRVATRQIRELLQFQILDGAERERFADRESHR